jgi:acetyl-CoA C-acetyltransferase
MAEVVIAGFGQTPVGEHWNLGLREIALAAIREAWRDQEDLRPEAMFVGNMLGQTISNQAQLGALLADYAGLTGIEAVTVESAGASGGAALRQGMLAVESGFVRSALVVGVEKLTDRIGPGVEAALSTAGDSDFEAVQGLTPLAQAALIAQRYVNEFDVPVDGFGGFAIVAHANGVGNPNAMFRKAISAKTYSGAAGGAEPLNQYDIAPMADGAAAVLLTRPEHLPPSLRDGMVRISGSAAAVDTLSLHDRKDVLAFEACAGSVRQALSRAGVNLGQIDLFEYHDAYSVFAALELEAAGFAERGGGWSLAANGAISLAGSIPCATMGGLKARGYPGGASGVYQAVEAILQLQKKAAPNQVKGARRALIQSVGGPGSTAISHVLELVG